jgi:hypothetical protein
MLKGWTDSKHVFLAQKLIKKLFNKPKIALIKRLTQKYKTLFCKVMSST